MEFIKDDKSHERSSGVNWNGDKSVTCHYGK